MQTLIRTFPRQQSFNEPGKLAEELLALGLSSFSCPIGLGTAFQAKGRKVAFEVLLRLPALGQIFIYTYTARIANTFAILLKGGVPLAQAFPIVRSAVGSSVFAEILSTAEERVREGEKLAEALADNQYFPNLATAMIASGEETGSLAEMLAHLAATYQYRADLGRKTLLSLVEPAIILVMGLLVGFVVVSVLVPIFDLNSYLN